MCETAEVNGTECVVIPKEEYERIHERIDQLEEVADLKQHNGREHAQINFRISDVADDIESIKETGSSDDEGSVPGPGTTRPSRPLRRRP